MDNIGGRHIFDFFLFILQQILASLIFLIIETGFAIFCLISNEN